ncbi:Small-conductance mechanosensitive channel [Acaryochloris thomasi RCC1774]|uniref:Small-conductance mechanosensitive channel n=1 Tax=Acaryochloris thomasi RCC1774 TaxID=1764569 RepID=A0A2W1J8Q5_9CYAN|nr:mechanosensitive ion channel domain-containing protein [Acaryochloris thomasi]PZD70743.1 Small-conductance mechanosensitive channel [Acaryochloris thomasi RCC1774]
MNDGIKALTEKLLLFTPQLISGLLSLLVFWFLSLVAGRIVDQVGRRSHLDRDIVNLLRRVVSVGIILVGITVSMGTMGVDVSAMVASLGLTGFALGFALKDVLSNLLSGVLVLTYRPFIRGDWITVSGLEGTVIEIDLRYTTLETEGDRILIPNSTLFTNPITVRKP